MVVPQRPYLARRTRQPHCCFCHRHKAAVGADLSGANRLQRPGSGYGLRYPLGQHGMLSEPLSIPGDPNSHPTPNPTPLLGPEWSMLAQGDLLGWGAETICAAWSGVPIH